MKRIKKISLILFFVLLFMPFTSINADRKATCADVMDAINELEDLDSTYTKLDCENAVESKIIYKCNKNRIRKSEVLEDIFNYNEKKVCPSIDLSSIISTYKDDCSNEFSSEVKTASDNIMKIFFVSAPFILILFGSLDFFKIVTASDAREIKKNRSNFIKRVIAFVLLYITPFIVKTLFSFTPYEMDGGYICSQEIDFNAKISTGELTGIYGGNNYGSGDGKAIAEAAKEIKENAINNGYTYGCNGLGPDKQGTSATGRMCCAELMGAALYKSGIYDLTEAKEYQTTVAPTLGRILQSKGWTLITDPDELQPGDAIFYEKLANQSEAGIVTINGKDIHICHTDIYYEDGKKVNTGGGFNMNNLIQKFKVNGECYGVSNRFAFAFRFPGKK